MPTTTRLTPTSKLIIDNLLKQSTKNPYSNLPSISVAVANSNSILYHGTSGYSHLPKAPIVLTEKQLNDLPEFQKLQSNSIWDLYSCTKLITVISVLQLVESGKISLEDDARLYVKELNDLEVFVRMEGKIPILKKNTKFISVLNLVNHTLGAVLPAVDGNPAGSVYLASADRETLTSRPLLYTPGEHWAYGFSNDWLSLLIEDVSGSKLEDYFRDNIFTPLNITDISFLTHLPIITPGKFPKPPSTDHTFGPLGPFSQKQHFGGAGLRGSTLSYLKIVQTILRGGVGMNNDGSQGARILKSETVDSMFKSSLPSNELGEKMKLEIRNFLENSSMNLNDTVVGKKLDWGLGGMLGVEKLSSGRREGSLSWSGYLNTYWVCDRKSDLVFVVFTNLLPWGKKEVYDLWAAVEPEIYKGLVVEKL